MLFLILSFLAVLFVCDVALIKLCNVKNGFSMYAFRFFVIMLAVVSLMLTGDITIASVVG